MVYLAPSLSAYGNTFRESGSYIKNGTMLYSFVYQMSNSEKTASSIVSDSPVESTDAKQPELPDSSYQRLWLVMDNCTTISFLVGD